MYSYWGKSGREPDPDSTYHLLVYHCLDVAAVGEAWLLQDLTLLNTFLRSSNLNEQTLLSLIKFFLALHDLGKFDIRFQFKNERTLKQLNPQAVTPIGFEQYDHGPAGLDWFIKDFDAYELFSDVYAHHAWIRAVTGHHGHLNKQYHGHRRFAPNELIAKDKQARINFIQELKKLFFPKENFATPDDLPEPPPMLPGFCCVCDWLGSNEEFFSPKSTVHPLNEYYNLSLVAASKALSHSGLISRTTGNAGMRDLYPNIVPRGVQTLVDDIPVRPGLTIIEAPTGSGKTEAALAYASKLLKAGLAEGIIFALPTQATANAMLGRLEKVVSKLFDQSGNVILAHGKARFNRGFQHLIKMGNLKDPQGEEEAAVQCSNWLAQSRKRVFLGQVGVCTVDQVLLSVLPVKHNFVRGFGLAKNVLVVDEIHAYDSYMNGLLDEVLKKQLASGGSAILMSATINNARRNSIFKTWGLDSGQTPNALYPLISHADKSGLVPPLVPADDHMPQKFDVKILTETTSDGLPSTSVIEQLIELSGKGAKSAVICNLVDDAQILARRLKSKVEAIGADLPIDLFHARFRFKDRDRIEQNLMKLYGGDREESPGRILVATQVVEQSLDLDFDYMVTQICPADLLFQRLGRLHRHVRNRPPGLKFPSCAIILPRLPDFGLHGLLYNPCILWRTQRLLEQNTLITFPYAYRNWIEQVYDHAPWEDEPAELSAAHERYIQDCQGKGFAARLIANEDTWFDDTDSNATALTRDGEMSLNLLPVSKDNHRLFLDGKPLPQPKDFFRDEEMQMNIVPVPGSWGGYLQALESERGIILLPLHPRDRHGWQSDPVKNFTYTYDPFYGLERRKNESAD